MVNLKMGFCLFIYFCMMKLCLFVFFFYYPFANYVIFLIFVHDLFGIVLIDIIKICIFGSDLYQYSCCMLRLSVYVAPTVHVKDMSGVQHVLAFFWSIVVRISPF